MYVYYQDHRRLLNGNSPVSNELLFWGRVWALLQLYKLLLLVCTYFVFYCAIPDASDVNKTKPNKLGSWRGPWSPETFLSFVLDTKRFLSFYVLYINLQDNSPWVVSQQNRPNAYHGEMGIDRIIKRHISYHNNMSITCYQHRKNQLLICK